MAREGKAPAFQMYAADWLADGDVRAMSLAERGAYIDLLCYCWREGSIPDDVTFVARWLGVARSEASRIWPVVRPRFTNEGAPAGRLVSMRMEQQRADLDHFRETAAAGGLETAARMTPEQRSERARKAAKSRYAASNEQAERKQSASIDDANPLLRSANTASASASAKIPLKPPKGGEFDFEALYDRYPRKVGKARGMRIAALGIRTLADYDALGRAIDAYAAEVAGKDPEYVAHFSTFMGRWRDHVPTETPEQELTPLEVAALEARAMEQGMRQLRAMGIVDDVEASR